MRRFRDVSIPAAFLLCLLVAVCPAWGGAVTVNTSAQTFILSNEGGGLITQLLNGGYGNVNPYQALVDIVKETNPSVAGIITPAFLQALQNCPPSSQIFTTTLSSYNGASIAISTDGTVQTTSVLGATYNGQSGTSTLVSAISGVGSADFTYSTTFVSPPLTSWNVNQGLGVTTTYNVFGIAWAPSQPPAPVPTLSPLAAILLGIGLCAAAIYLMRKRAAVAW